MTVNCKIVMRAKKYGILSYMFAFALSAHFLQLPLCSDKVQTISYIFIYIIEFYSESAHILNNYILVNAISFKSGLIIV